jgi:hypothetical protein
MRKPQGRTGGLLSRVADHKSYGILQGEHDVWHERLWQDRRSVRHAERSSSTRSSHDTAATITTAHSGIIDVKNLQ